MSGFAGHRSGDLRGGFWRWRVDMLSGSNNGVFAVHDAKLARRIFGPNRDPYLVEVRPQRPARVWPVRIRVMAFRERGIGAP